MLNWLRPLINAAAGGDASAQTALDAATQDALPDPAQPAQDAAQAAQDASVDNSTPPGRPERNPAAPMRPRATRLPTLQPQPRRPDRVPPALATCHAPHPGLGSSRSRPCASPVVRPTSWRLS